DKEVAMYKEFILKCRKIVVDKLHRRPIMWDDMFDYYPHLLADMPRDLIMAHWQYQEDVYTSTGHFGNRRRENRLEKYDELGFNYLIAPATNLTSNGRTFSEYASCGKNLLGGLMTTWVTHLRFMYKVFPVIASIGRYWDGQGSEEDCFKSFVEKYFDNADEELIQALRCYSENNSTRFTSFTALNTSKHGFGGVRYGANARRNLELAILKNKYPQITNLVGKRIIEEIIIMLELECAIFDLEKLVRDIPRKLTTPEEITAALAAVQSKADNYSAKWEEWRPGLIPNSIAAYLNKFISNTQAHCEKLFKGNYLRILFATCNQYGAEPLDISLVKNGVKHLVKHGCFRGDNCYEQILPLVEAIEADAIVIEAQGYGGQGIAYAELVLGDKTFVPSAAYGEGMVTNPEFVLEDDCTHAFMGSQDSMASWKDRAVAEKVHTLTIQLKQK
ncbi:MAG: hypothetical protein J6Q81_01665, partial [Lentisphaeria bacterium]|nr:hypothetical protein [Lentisphaeria bacterium]